MSEQIDITPEQIAAYQRRQQEQELQAEQTCIDALRALANEFGFVIIAVPQMEVDARLQGRITAQWGVKRK